MDGRLLANVQEQLCRLLTQLSDLEELKQELEPDEYERDKQETLERIKEFNQYVDRLSAGDMTIVDGLASIKLALQAALASVVRTPEVLKMFAMKQPAQLRDRLTSLQRDVKLGKAHPGSQDEIREILTALQRLGDTLSAGEQALLAECQGPGGAADARNDTPAASFEELDESAATAKFDVLAMATKQG
eukprot:jgi/Mesvir1/12220/Mv00448-RA.1